MKQIIIASLLLLITAQFAIAELTKEDLKEIEKLFDRQKEEIKNYIDLKTEVLDARIKAFDAKIDQKFGELDTKIGQKVETTNATIAGVQKAIEILQWVIGILALFFAAGIVLPAALQEIRERKRTSLTKRIEKLEQKLADLTEQRKG